MRTDIKLPIVLGRPLGRQWLCVPLCLWTTGGCPHARTQIYLSHPATERPRSHVGFPSLTLPARISSCFCRLFGLVQTPPALSRLFLFFPPRPTSLPPHPPIFFFFYFLVLYSFPGSLIRCQPMGGPFFFFFFFYFAIFLSLLIPSFPFWPRPLNLEDGVCSKRGKKREKKTFQTNKINQEEGRPRPSLLARRNNTRSSRRKSLTAGERAAESCPVQKKKEPPLGCVLRGYLQIGSLFQKTKNLLSIVFWGRKKKKKIPVGWILYGISRQRRDGSSHLFFFFSPLGPVGRNLDTRRPSRPSPRSSLHYDAIQFWCRRCCAAPSLIVLLCVAERRNLITDSVFLLLLLISSAQWPAVPKAPPKTTAASITHRRPMETIPVHIHVVSYLFIMFLRR